jgi:hypothetical protein
MSDQQTASVTTTAEVPAVSPAGPAGDCPGGDTGIEDFGDLPGRPLRKRMGPLTYLLLAALVACAAFYGGARYEKSSGTSASASGFPAGLASRFASSSTGKRSFPGGLSFPTGSSGSASSKSTGSGAGSYFGLGTAVSGTVKLITGKSFYVEEATGTIVKVATTPGTTISISSAGSVSQLHPGDSVTVLGKNKNGTVSATSVSDSGNGGVVSSGGNG